MSWHYIKSVLQYCGKWKSSLRRTMEQKELPRRGENLPFSWPDTSRAVQALSEGVRASTLSSSKLTGRALSLLLSYEISRGGSQCNFWSKEVP